MIDFITKHKQMFEWLVIVMAAITILILLTNLFGRWMIKKIKEKYPDEGISAIHSIVKILRTTWIIMGIIAISLFFINEEYHQDAIEKFYLAFYIGIIAVLTIISATGTNLWFRHSIKQKKILEQDYTSQKFFRYLAVLGIYFIGALLILMVFPVFGGIVQTALGGAGIVTVITGLASQEALANLVGGIFIILFKPFKIGDLVKVDNSMVGKVTDITLRHTIIQNYENKMIVIPNSIINKEKIVNYDLVDSTCCEWIEIGISYNSDIDLAKRIMCEECESHPHIVDYRSQTDIDNGKPKVMVKVINLGDSAIKLRAWVWAQNYEEAFSMRCDLFESIKKRFDKEGVEIPFPHRTVVMKKESNDHPPD